MDHLPAIDDAADLPDEVECMVTDSSQYDGSGLANFAMQAGFFFKKGIGKYARENYTLEVERTPGSPAQKVAFIQSWLFFGVLVETFAPLGISLNTCDFVTMRNGCKYLTLVSLEKYVSNWASLERDRDADTRDRHRAKLDELLELAEILAQENLRRGKRYEVVWSLSTQCALSIQLLHEALRHVWGTIYTGIDKLVTSSGAGLLSDLPEKRMRAAGWCPSEIAMLQNRFSVTGRYFASRLRRRGKAMNHASCNDVICNASQIDNSTYVTQHTSDNCQCAHLDVDPQKVGSVLKQGRIPRFLIRPCVQSQDQIDLQIVDSGPYVAISHVWAHGLGNAQSNSLPLCQLRRLHGYAERLSKSTNKLDGRDTMAVWIDTLGVPLLRESRKLALRLLPRTYSESTCCLVIDEEIRETSHESTLEEICMRLVFCAWARRLWTFQEGVLTWDKLYLQFKEGPIQFQSFRGPDQTFSCSSLRLESVEETKSTLPRVEDFRAAEGDLIEKLTDACKYRTTSRISDQTFCLASIAGFDLQEIVEASTHEEKMRLFLLRIRDLPSRIIFFKGPKMSIDRFSWAPLSILHPERSQSFFGLDEDDTNTALCTPHGLQGRWPGFFLELPSTTTPRDLYYFAYGESWVIIHSIDAMQRKLHGFTAKAEDVSVWQQVHKLPRLGLLVHSLDLLQKMGLIISIVDEDTKALTARSMLSVSAMLVPMDEVDIFDPTQLHPSRALEIKGISMNKDKVLNLI